MPSQLPAKSARTATSVQNIFMFAAPALAMSAWILASSSSVAASNAWDPLPRTSSINCSELFGSTPRHNYLNLDERMELAMGEWGRNVVHPLGPNYFRFQRDKRDKEALKSACRLRAQKTNS
jgi:hypothetical protein